MGTGVRRRSPRALAQSVVVPGKGAGWTNRLTVGDRATWPRATRRPLIDFRPCRFGEALMYIDVTIAE